jgi:uncharacterized protein YbbC (DUF1343 family)
MSISFVRAAVFSLLLAACLGTTNCGAQTPLTGADQLDRYLPLLANKKVALVINQTSRIGDSSLLDVLRSRGINIRTIFVPEHGFRGTADAGAHVASGVDPLTRIPVTSLYGNHKKPSAEELRNVDIVIYDLQDVGVRFYTYISTLQYVMEACAANGKEVMVLDRPNPNGFYVDGPVLDTALRSFVGMQPIPVVYGMTAGEYAKMLIGERWFTGAFRLKLTVVPCSGYDHRMMYSLPVSPSPNLKTDEAVQLYPALCLFEGTVVSVGRGTEKPFQHWGHPDFSPKIGYSFTPTSTVGASKPLYEGRRCYGMAMANNSTEALSYMNGKMRLEPLLQAYEWYGRKPGFFNSFFEKLAGTNELRRQVEAGMSEDAIRKTWKPGLDRFRKIRKRYLLYRDF